MELTDVMRTTFACRDFTDDDVSDALLYEIFDTARFAPSGGNRQGNHAIIVRDQAMKELLGEASRPAGKLYTAQNKAGESPWNSIIPTTVTPEVEAATEVPKHLTEPAKNAPSPRPIRNWSGLASSAAARSFRLSGTHCWPHETRAWVVPSPRWPWRKSRNYKQPSACPTIWRWLLSCRSASLRSSCLSCAAVPWKTL